MLRREIRRDAFTGSLSREPSEDVATGAGATPAPAPTVVNMDPKALGEASPPTRAVEPAASAPLPRALALARAAEHWPLRLNLVAMELAVPDLDAADGACRRFLSEDFRSGGARCEQLWQLWALVQRARVAPGAWAATAPPAEAAYAEELLWRARLSETGPGQPKWRGRNAARKLAKKKARGDTAPWTADEDTGDEAGEGEEGGEDGPEANLLPRPHRFEHWHALVLAASHSRAVALQLIACAFSEQLATVDAPSAPGRRPGSIDASIVWEWCRPRAPIPKELKEKAATSRDDASTATVNGVRALDARALPLAALPPSTGVMSAVGRLAAQWRRSASSWSAAGPEAAQEAVYLHLLSVLWTQLVGPPEETVVAFEAAIEAASALPTPPASLMTLWLRYLDWSAQRAGCSILLSTEIQARYTEAHRDTPTVIRALLTRCFSRTRALPARTTAPTAASSAAQPRNAFVASVHSRQLLLPPPPPPPRPRPAAASGDTESDPDPNPDPNPSNWCGRSSGHGTAGGEGVARGHEGSDREAFDAAYDEGADVELLAVLDTEPARSWTRGCMSGSGGSAAAGMRTRYSEDGGGRVGGGRVGGGMRAASRGSDSAWEVETSIAALQLSTERCADHPCPWEMTIAKQLSPSAAVYLAAGAALAGRTNEARAVLASCLLEDDVPEEAWTL